MNPLEIAEPDQKPTAAFEQEARFVLDELRAALAEVVRPLRPPVRRAADLHRRLGLSQKVGWSVFKAATAEDCRAVASLVPGQRAMEGFFQAAARNGVPPGALGRARSAFERFEESVARHAGSREAYETMAAALGGGTPDSDTDLKHKRAVFRSLSLLWGRQTRVWCMTRILHPGATDGLLDKVILDGMVGLRRTRSGVALRIRSDQSRWTGPGDPEKANPPEPLDPREAGPGSVWLLRDFCSRPLPELRVLEMREAGNRTYELVSDRLGASGEVTYFTAEVCRAVSATPSSVPGAEVSICAALATAAEAYNGDILIHKSVCSTHDPEVRVYSLTAPPGLQTEFHDSDLLPLTEQGKYLGEGLGAARTPLIPRYTEMLAYAMERMGWNPDEFRVFRCRVDYPVLHTRIRMTLR